MSEPAVIVSGLVKRYGANTVLDGIDFEIQKGEVFGLLGKNGAGKTTTLECLEGMRRMDGGTIRVAGRDVREERHLRRKLGIQLQSSSLPGEMRVSEAIALICAFSKTAIPKQLIRTFQIEELCKKQYGKLSTGQKRRVQLLLALLNDPEVVVLDEPTAGLDVKSRVSLHNEIRAISQRGVTVLLATHDMAEAEELCSRVAILAGGKIAACAAPEEITASGGAETRIRLRTGTGTARGAQTVTGARFAGEKNGYYEWSCPDAAACVIEILKGVMEADDTVEDLRVLRPTLEERFLELTEGADDR